jgi:hypothetical protein
MWNPVSLLAAIYNRWSRKKDRRAEAAIALRSAFFHELKDIYPLPSDWPKGPGIEKRLRQALLRYKRPSLASAHSLRMTKRRPSTRHGWSTTRQPSGRLTRTTRIT